jgi:hypothetical protein
MDRCSRRPASIDRSVPPQPAPSVATSHYRQTKHLLAFFFLWRRQRSAGNDLHGKRTFVMRHLSGVHNKHLPCTVANTRQKKHGPTERGRRGDGHSRLRARQRFNLCRAPGMPGARQKFNLCRAPYGLHTTKADSLSCA